MSSDWSGGGDSGSGGGVEFPGATGAHEVVTVTEEGWLSRLASSVVGWLLGGLLFLGSFVVLYWNEGRPDAGSLAAQAVEVSAERAAGLPQGKLVAAHGTLQAAAPLGDAYLQAGDYLSLSRRSEMYAWVEHRETKTEKKLGGGERKITRHTYQQEWTSHPSQSSSFKQPAGHQNPVLAVKSEDLHAQGMRVGALAVEAGRLSLPSSQALRLRPDQVLQGKLDGEHLYLGGAQAGQPKVGDVRLSYEALPSRQEVTAFGAVQGDRLVPFEAGGQSLYRAFPGTKAQAVAGMHQEHKAMTWILRVVGFLCMWGGMMLGLGPIHVLMDVIPFLGDLGRGLSGVMTFLVALVLTAITIVVSMILHSFVAMVVVTLLGLVGAVAFLGKKKGLPRLA